jgi:hypothetical protein
MRRLTIRSACALAAMWLLAAPLASAQEMPDRYKTVLTTLGRQGDFKDNVLKVNVPRSDLSVTVAGIKTPTPFGFGGWLAMTRGSGDMDVMMGDLVLTQDEVNPVMSALLANGLEVTALHNHFFWDEPRVYYMHVHGRGTPQDLARKVKPALDLIGRRGAAETATGRSQGAKPVATSGTSVGGPAALDTAQLARIVGHQGEQSGAVYKITVGRDDLKLTDMGAPINSRMGLNTWAAFVGTDAKAAIAGDVAMLEDEVTRVLKTLRRNGLDVVAIHHHMLEDESKEGHSAGRQPTIIFLHYWGTGPAKKLATGFKETLDQLGRGARHGE